jgi:hypothetical protein
VVVDVAIVVLLATFLIVFFFCAKAKVLMVSNANAAIK